MNETLKGLKEVAEKARAMHSFKIDDNARASLSVLSEITESVKNAQKQWASFASTWESVIAPWKTAWDVLSETIKKLKVPTISEERKQELLSNYETWGKFGWTPDPDERLYSLFFMDPGQRTEADCKALKLVKDTDKLFDEIRKKTGIKRSDFEEAVLDFEDKRYKSCSLILFSLIDAKLIRIQKRKKKTGKRRESGLRAVDYARKISKCDDQKELLFLALYYCNVFSCLNVMFASGKDFEQQPSIINRNFIVHGMMWDKVTRKSCIQLFLLYYNTLEMLELIRM